MYHPDAVGVIVGSFMLLFGAAIIVFRVPISTFWAKFPLSSPNTPHTAIGGGLLFVAVGAIFLVAGLIGR